MHTRYFTLLGALSSFVVLAQQPLAIPPLLEQDTFMLNVGPHTHQFYPGVTTPTLGVNGEFLGPTLLFNHGDTARLRVQNDMSEITTMHWHGMHVSGDQDGGPQRIIEPGEYWDAKYKVVNPAGTYWYHPHPHMMTASQVTRGVAGMIIVRDDLESALDLPRTYGVDDIPVVIQDRRFLANGNMVVTAYGDSLLVNGTPRPFVDLPAQVVRLRLLNGSNSRVYRIGLQGDSTFHMIAGDGGMLNATVPLQRLSLSNGERAEILLDLSGMEGDSLLLMSFGSELSETVPGSANILWETSALNGIDFPVLRIRVQAPTSEPVTTLPTSLVSVTPIPETQATRTRVKTITGNGMVSMGMFLINGQEFNMDVVNDTVALGSTEIWTFVNNSNMAHPMHIHGVSFYVIDRNGVPVAPEEAGAKDVVLVERSETVRTIMRFDHPTNGYPYMYHCHNLMHEDHMMMLQFNVTDMTTSIPEAGISTKVHVFPNPTTASVRYEAPFAVESVRVIPFGI
ncbi:MAG: multicopper oxidase domain-containing protein [Flavobacteriales bacterium]